MIQSEEQVIMNKNKRRFYAALILIPAITGSLSLTVFGQSAVNENAQEILKECDINGGFIVHIGCGRGKLPLVYCAPIDHSILFYLDR